MTESDWLSSNDPAKMLRHLTHDRVPAPGARGFQQPETMEVRRTAPLVSDRKLRLFAVACWRYRTGKFRDGPSRWQAEVATAAEQWADTGITPADPPLPVTDPTGWFEPLDADACRAARQMSVFGSSIGDEEKTFQVNLLCDIVGNPYRRYLIASPIKVGVDRFQWRKDDGSLVSIGDALSPLTIINRNWLTPTALALAHAAYDERVSVRCPECAGTGDDQRPIAEGDCPHCHGAGYTIPGTLDPDRLAVLADALEDAGAHGEILAHLRSPGPHYRGCHVLDRLLGKI